jgi:hypothetical protein
MLIEESRLFKGRVSEFVYDFDVTAVTVRFESAEDSLLFFEQDVLAVPKVGRHGGKISFSTSIERKGKWSDERGEQPEEEELLALVVLLLRRTGVFLGGSGGFLYCSGKG